MHTTNVSVSDLEFSMISDLVEKRSAIRLEPDKKFLADVRIPTVLRSSALGSVSELLDRVRGGDKKLEASLVDAFTTNETLFFRDQSTFEILRTQVLAPLFASGTTPIKVWSAACSTGQEAYSLLMTAHQSFASPTRMQVAGTDLNQRVLKQATDGVYTQFEVGRGLPSALLVKYFSRDGLNWVVKPELRRQATFHAHNLLDPPRAFEAYDLIMLRNVLCYFGDAARQRVLGNARAALKPGGVIVFGCAETPPSNGFVRVHASRGDLLRLPA